MGGDLIVDGLPYSIVLADDAAATLPRILRPSVRSAIIVFDRHVEYRATAIAAALAAGGMRILGSVPLAGGEAAKQSSTVTGLYDDFLDSGCERGGAVIAIGGGTITDVAGYAAATYLRGVAWAAVPTTVLGMADAAIGGKTGIDLPQGKNLVGAFWPPVAVVGDIAALATLPDGERATGLVEAVKCAIIGDPGLLDGIDALATRPDLQADWEGWKVVIAAAARIKVEVVADDPRESGRRAVLNLGHTVGHAIETLSDHRVTHGAAVAVGVRAAGLIARERGWWPHDDHVRVLNVLHRAGVPLHAEGLSVDGLMEVVARDKKSVDGRVRFVLPVALGDVRHGVDVPSEVVRSAVAACLHPPDRTEWNG